MAYKLYITDEEYDRLNWHEQKDFHWCNECQHFYSHKDLPQGCEHGRAEGGTIWKIYQQSKGGSIDGKL